MTTCRACRSDRLYTFLPLGDHPPANAFLRDDQLDQPEPAYPLDCQVCLDCGIVVVSDQLPPDFFGDYLYVPSASPTMHDHFDRFASEVQRRWVSGPDDLVVDVGCNDGLFLAACRAKGQAGLGIEPAANIAELARARGVEVENSYFAPDLARTVRAERGPAKVITTSNTFNHIDDLHGFMEAVVELLADDGTFIVEVPQALELVEQNEFDTVYHEHLSTFSVTSLVKLYAFFSMKIVDVEVLPIHGGSMRVAAQRSDATDERPAVQEWLDREREHGLLEAPTYDALADRVRRIRTDLLAMLADLKAQGKRLAGYGAPAKGNTLLNYFGIGPDTLEFLADRNELKQGRYSPGMRIPVVHPGRIMETKPDYLLILAWNFADEILEQQRDFAEAGGRFIIPIPEPRIVG